jgi:hypothetical protein
MKKPKYSRQFLEEIRKVPIVQVACEKVGISRNTVYRWKREDDSFAKEFEEALADGVEFVNDMSESQLLQLIKEKNFSAVRFWLNKRHPAYKDKLEVDGKLKHTYEPDEEQKELIERALTLGKINHEEGQTDNQSD